MRSTIWLCGCILIVSCSGSSTGISGDAGDSGTQIGSGGGEAAGGGGGTMAGTGGATTGSGSNGNNGGTTGKDGGVDVAFSCAEIETMYQAALKVAQSCDPRTANQCQKSAEGNLASCAGCLVLVNDDTELNRLKQQWQQRNCSSPVVCPNMGLVCLPPQGACIPTADDTNGICRN